MLMIAKLLLRAQLHNDQEATEQILESFTPKIIASMHHVPADHREDLKQELYAKMIEVIHSFDLN